MQPADRDESGQTWSAIPLAVAVVVTALGFLPIANWIAAGYEFPVHERARPVELGHWHRGRDGHRARDPGPRNAVALAHQAGRLVGVPAERSPTSPSPPSPLSGACCTSQSRTGSSTGARCWSMRSSKNGRTRSSPRATCGFRRRAIQSSSAPSSWSMPADRSSSSFRRVVPPCSRSASSRAPRGSSCRSARRCLSLRSPRWRAWPPNARIAIAAVALFAVAPFTVFMSGSHMNHVTALMGILVGAGALLHVTARPAEEGGRPGLAFVSGLGFGPPRRFDRSMRWRLRRRPLSGTCGARFERRANGLTRWPRWPAWRCRYARCVRERAHDGRTAALGLSGAVGPRPRSGIPPGTMADP